MRAAIYIRMSTPDQTESPERQRELILAYCQRKGYEVVREYEDLAMRGSDSTRPGFQRLLEDAQKGLFDLIVVDEQSRLSRTNPVEYIAKVVFPLQQVDVYVEVVDQGRRLTWEDDDFAGQLFSFIGQHKASSESSTLGRRTATGMAKKAKEGKMFTGRAAYGFRYKMEGGTRVCLEPDTDAPEKAEVVRQMFDAYANRDHSLMSIVAYLNTSGIVSPRGCSRWGKHTVHGILTNHAYAGCYVWGKVPQGKFFRSDGGEILPVGKKANSSERRPSSKWLIIPEQHDPIVSPELFDKVQRRLVANRSRTSPSRKRESYTLSQLLRCSNCGNPMYGTKRKSGGVVEPVYRCGGDMVRATCAPRVVVERVVLERVAEVLKKHLLDPVERERLLAEIRRQSAQQGGDDAEAPKALRAKLRKLDADITKASGNLSLLDPEFIPETQSRIRGWKQVRVATQSELDRLVRRSPDGSVDHIVGKVERLVEVMKSGSSALVRPLIRETIERIDLNFDTMKKKKVTRYPLLGGVVHLFGCVDSDRSGPTAAR